MQADIIMRCRAGEVDAWEALVRDVYPRAKKIARRMLRDQVWLMTQCRTHCSNGGIMKRRI